VLKPPPPPPPQAGRKGKAPVQPTQRIYINCSIGDALSAEDLASEASSARAPSPAAPVAAPTTTAAQPRGFDRLLTSVDAYAGYDAVADDAAADGGCVAG
ncbi:hypothetical protein V501_02935, partial [Pseudogymnoascus sp. VKM F-4519 (FW-2642)]